MRGIELSRLVLMNILFLILWAPSIVHAAEYDSTKSGNSSVTVRVENRSENSEGHQPDENEDKGTEQEPSPPIQSFPSTGNQKSSVGINLIGLLLFSIGLGRIHSQQSKNKANKEL